MSHQHLAQFPLLTSAPPSPRILASIIYFQVYLHRQTCVSPTTRSVFWGVSPNNEERFGVLTSLVSCHRDQGLAVC
jgi:hypothetical protein